MTARRLAAAVVALIALLAYSPVLTNPFVNADDERWLFGREVIRSGSLAELVAPHADRAGFMPLGHLILAGVYRAGGGELLPFRAAALALHAIGAVLLFLLTLRLLEAGTGADPARGTSRLVAAGAGAALFAAHPIHAETVAIASSLHDLAACVLTLLAAFLYVEWVRVGRGRLLLVASVATFALAGMARWTAVGLPVALLALDAYPLRRLSRESVLEKLPYALIAAVVVAANACAKMTITGEEGVYSTVIRPAAIASGLLFYVWKPFAPGEYDYFYLLDRPEGLLGLSSASCILVCGALLAALVRERRRVPAALVAAVVVLAFTGPTLIAATNGAVVARNRYAYLPCAALFAAVAAAALQAWAAGGRRRPVLAALPYIAAAVLAAGFAAQARSASAGWHDISRHWTPHIVSDPEAFFGHHALGEELLRRGYYGDAMRQFQTQLIMRPGDERAKRRLEVSRAGAEAIAYNNRGVALAAAGSVDEAIESFRRALARRPDLAPAKRNLAILLKRR